MTSLFDPAAHASQAIAGVLYMQRVLCPPRALAPRAKLLATASHWAIARSIPAFSFDEPPLTARPAGVDGFTRPVVLGGDQ